MPISGKMYRVVMTCISAVAMGVFTSCAGVANNPSSPTTPPINPSSPNGSVSVSGTQILRDGKVWIPHGLYQIAFEAPAAYLPQETNTFWATAQQNYQPTEYAQMIQFGADSVRIQVAQTGIDPSGKYFTPAYRDEAVGAIKAARAAGLTVVVSVQDEAQTGETDQLGLPGPATQRVWAYLAPLFGQDTGVLFEMLNEPFIGAFVERPPSATDWATWANSMNATIANIRDQGAKNVVIADGLVLGEELSGAPQLSDPLQQVVYGVHPYSHNSDDQNKSSVWDEKFGDFSKTEPVMVSEWGVGYYCDDNTGTASVAFLQYLQNHSIGLQAGTWDWAPLGFGSVIEGFPTGQATSFAGTAGQSLCNAQGAIKTKLGPGALVEAWYQTGVPSTKLL